MSELVLDEVSVRYGDHVAVGGLSLSVAEGEVVALLGPSGCGKSSVLRAIAGLEPLAGGTVRFAGRDLAGVPVHRRQLGLMFQDSVLFGHLDVAGNVAFGLRHHGWGRRRARHRVGELLELVGLAGYGHRPVRTLSGGEAQRVALARALAPAPRLLMLDEPLGALDRPLRQQLTAELRQLLGRLGQTALHVTHDQVEASALADRVAVLRSGRLVQVGAPQEVWARPVDAFVARFMGHPNLWPVRVEASGAVRRGAAVLGALRPDQRLDAAGAAWLVVPVTALRPDRAGPIDGRVVGSELRDGSWWVRLDSADGDVWFRSDGAVSRGSGCRLAVDVGACHLVGPGESHPRGV